MEHKSPRDKELIAAGWTRRFAASEPRRSEAVAEYRDLGFEVLVEPVDLCPADGTCTICLAENPDYVKVIYTRPQTGLS